MPSRRVIRQLRMRMPGTNPARNESVRILVPRIFQVEENSLSTNTNSGAVPFVWRPNEPNPGGNVFATWVTLYAALSAAQGTKLVVVDTSLAPATIPSGAYNVDGVTFEGFRQAATQTIVTLADGALLTDLRWLTGIDLQTQTTGANQLAFTSSNPVLGLERSMIQAVSGVAPIQYSIAGSPGLQIGLLLGSFLGDAISPVLDLGATGQAGIFLDDVAGATNNCVSGDPGSLVVFTYNDGSFLPDALPSFSGTRFMNPIPGLVNNILYVATSGNDFSGDGSKQRPLATLQEALNRSQNETVIFLEPGSYPAAAIPVSPPRSDLSIVAQGRVIIGNFADAFGLELPADAASADSIRSLRLQGLTLRGEVGLRISDSNAANDFFLADGLFLEGTILEGSIASCSIERVNNLFVRGNVFRGDANFVQCGGGQVNGNVFGNAEFAFDSTAPFPNLTSTLFVDSSTFVLLSVEGSIGISVGKEVVCSEFLASPRQLAGDVMRLHFQGRTDESIVDYLSTDTAQHQLDFDQCDLGNFDSFFDSNPAATRQPISMRSAATGTIVAGADVDIDLEDSSNVLAYSGGVGPTLGTIRRQFTENIQLNIAPNTVVFSTPMPDDSYTVSIEPILVCSWAVFNKTATGFDYSGSVNGVPAIATITPRNF